MGKQVRRPVAKGRVYAKKLEAYILEVFRQKWTIKIEFSEDPMYYAAVAPCDDRQAVLIFTPSYFKEDFEMRQQICQHEVFHIVCFDLQNREEWITNDLVHGFFNGKRCPVL